MPCWVSAGCINDDEEWSRLDMQYWITDLVPTLNTNRKCFEILLVTEGMLTPHSSSSVHTRTLCLSSDRVSISSFLKKVRLALVATTCTCILSCFGGKSLWSGPPSWYQSSAHFEQFSDYQWCLDRRHASRSHQDHMHGHHPPFISGHECSGHLQW